MQAYSNCFLFFVCNFPLGHELATVGDSILSVYYPVAPSWSFQPWANVHLNSTLDQRMLHSLPNKSHSLVLVSVSHWTQHEEINTAAPIDSDGMVGLISATYSQCPE